jgi:2-succinyl-6-hydroxy-2,4-cyclohexadiene-1-carboxylate synthase
MILPDGFSEGSETVIALPGFLGKPEEWTALIPHARTPVLPLSPFWEWADQLNVWAKSLPAPRLLAGYSLGGRLALHALLRAPSLWNRALILSAHTGLIRADLKKKRLQEDRHWAKRFREEPWDQVLTDWNQRGALQSSRAIERRESEYSREELARTLETWSLGAQENLRPALEKLDVPILWMVGEYDTTFCTHAKNLKLRHPHSRIATVPGSGHRLLSDRLLP